MLALALLRGTSSSSDLSALSQMKAATRNQCFHFKSDNSFIWELLSSVLHHLHPWHPLLWTRSLISVIKGCCHCEADSSPGDSLSMKCLLSDYIMFLLPTWWVITRQVESSTFGGMYIASIDCWLWVNPKLCTILSSKGLMQKDLLIMHKIIILSQSPYI